MNCHCQNARDRLIDLAYGELSPSEARELSAHAESCPTCRVELRNLRLARQAMSRMRSSEPPASALALPAFAAGRRLAFWRYVAPAALAAAAVLAIVWLWRGFAPPPAVAETGPVEIRRIGVSLTILSQPPDWRPPIQPTATQAAQVRQQADIPYGPAWPGLALVRDQRIVRRLPKGVSSVAFADVPAGIQPDTVRLRSLDDGDGMKILEQNYQYDLASAEAILRRYLDKTVTVTFKDGEAGPKGRPQADASGELLSFDARTLVLRPAGQGPRSIDRRQVKAVAFEKLPEGLLATPTLLWKLQNRSAARQQFEVAYLTQGLFWRADYVLKLHPAAGKSEILPRQARDPEQGRGENSKPETILDTADLVGYATVTNNSGVRYENAQLKLMAGDVNLIKPPKLQAPRLTLYDGRAVYFQEQEEFAEKSFFEYHLYTLGRPTTLASAETKQIELVSGGGIRLTRGYVYDPAENPTAARVVSEFQNTEENGLGKPLPKGVVRLYAPDDEGQDAFVSQAEIDHTPVKEKIRLPWGYAFDIGCSTRDVDSLHRGFDHSLRKEFELRNHKDYDVTVTVVAHVPASTYKAACDRRWHVRQVGVVEIEVPVPAGQTATATLDYSWNDRSGGGLKSPDEPENPKSLRGP